MKKNHKPRKFLSYLFATGIFTITAFLFISACTDQSAKAKLNLIFKDAPNSETVAKVAGQNVTLDELIGDGRLQYLDLQKRIYEFKMERLKKLMQERLIGKEATDAKMSVADYIEKKIAGGKISVGEKEIKNFVKEKKIPDSQLNAQLKERIVDYLKTKIRDDLVEAHLAKLTKGTPVEVYFQKPKMQVAVEIGNAPVWGDKKAPVTIVEFSDFQCPFCSRSNATVEELKKKFKGKIQIAYKHFPLSFHKQAEPAGLAALCVNEQGNDKFWKMHNVLFDNQKSLEPADLEKYAKQVGVDMAKWKDCFDSKKYLSTIKEDLAYGEKLGVRSTPTFFINGELVSGAVPLEDFTEVVEEALAATKN